ncbi:MAG: DUF2798 domain-containing protein [Alphaproteobacteria bacterium]|nr:DUF2798 domain-containing protein [Alphaproteobacteria bacterium]
MTKFPHRLRMPIFGILMALAYSGIMSGLFIGLVRGFSIETIPIWLKGWGTAFLIAVPIGIVLRPVAERIATSITREASEG